MQQQSYAISTHGKIKKLGLRFIKGNLMNDKSLI